jgi:hypothetical protein
MLSLKNSDSRRLLGTCGPTIKVLFCFLALSYIASIQSLSESLAKYFQSQHPKHSTNRPRLTGRVAFKNDGFLITIPRNVMAYGPNCDLSGVCGSMHGFEGSLEADPDGTIYVFAEHSPAAGAPPKLITSLEDARSYVLDAFIRSGTDVEIQESEPATLDGLPAIRLLSRARRTQSSTNVLKEFIALRQLSQNETILYQIGMIASPGQYNADLQTFVETVKSFRRIPVR